MYLILQIIIMQFTNFSPIWAKVKLNLNLIRPNNLINLVNIKLIKKKFVKNEMLTYFIGF